MEEEYVTTSSSSLTVRHASTLVYIMITGLSTHLIRHLPLPLLGVRGQRGELLNEEVCNRRERGIEGITIIVIKHVHCGCISIHDIEYLDYPPELGVGQDHVDQAFLQMVNRRVDVTRISYEATIGCVDHVSLDMVVE